MIAEILQNYGRTLPVSSIFFIFVLAHSIREYSLVFALMINFVNLNCLEKFGVLVKTGAEILVIHRLTASYMRSKFFRAI